jgi:hypothetical protein
MASHPLGRNHRHLGKPSSRLAWSFVGLLPIVLATGCRSDPAHPSEWTALFNGKDLSGWTIQCQPQDRDKIFWTVADGAIVCDSLGRPDHNYVWLLTDEEFADFELRLQFQAYRDSPGNSGLQFRSRFDAAANGGWLDGPQVDIHPPESMSWRTGLIYDETREEKRWISPSLKNATMDPRFKPESYVFKYADDGDGWNDLVLICRGTRVKTILNGVVRTDWDGAGVLDNANHVRHNVGRVGHFALQLHARDQLRIRFRDIRLRRLLSPTAESQVSQLCGSYASLLTNRNLTPPRPQNQGPSRAATHPAPLPAAPASQH